jgi:hypothetical protein
MELAEQLDPEQWHRIMDRFFQLLAAASVGCPIAGRGFSSHALLAPQPRVARSLPAGLLLPPVFTVAVRP